MTGSQIGTGSWNHAMKPFHCLLARSRQNTQGVDVGTERVALGGSIKEGKRSTAAVVDWHPAPSLRISAVFPWSTNADCRKCSPNQIGSMLWCTSSVFFVPWFMSYELWYVLLFISDRMWIDTSSKGGLSNGSQSNGKWEENGCWHMGNSNLQTRDKWWKDFSLWPISTWVNAAAGQTVNSFYHLP